VWITVVALAVCFGFLLGWPSWRGLISLIAFLIGLLSIAGTFRLAQSFNRESGGGGEDCERAKVRARGARTAVIGLASGVVILGPAEMGT
jgi:ABC-type branched-subunit amino acid transport system permease subunit